MVVRMKTAVYPLTRKMLFSILFACLGWLANLLTNRLPLVVLVLLDGIQQCLALWTDSGSASWISTVSKLEVPGYGIWCTVPHLQQTQHNACPGGVLAWSRYVKLEPSLLTLYQCFFTLPSVRVGNVYLYVSFLCHQWPTGYSPTLAISAQLFPASRIAFSRCSSAGVHGVLVRLFLAGGGTGAEFASSVAAVGAGAATGCGTAGAGTDGCGCG